ncbi:hypothetical protein FACS1894102_0820 [Spirochaetia bacterium]|nr:hypothetical protein FACS1894102_0820 [Spirochaetia bacterium]
MSEKQEQIEFTNETPVFDPLGRPQNFGWARSPVFLYDSSLAWTPRRLITESERYVIFNATHLFVFEIYDNGILGHIRTVAVSLHDKKIVLKTEKINFPMGIIKLQYNEIFKNNESPNNKEQNKSLRYNRNKTIMEFIVMDNINKILKVDVPGIKHNLRLRGEVVLSADFAKIKTPAQIIATNSPWSTQKNSFQVLSCCPCYSVEGVMQFENKGILFSKHSSFGIHESAIIARPQQDVHYWASACGISDGLQISFNIGYGLSDSSDGTENAFFMQGVLHKLNVVTFKIPNPDWMKTWHITSNDGRLEMIFKPVQLFTSKLYMFYYSFRVVQLFGSFSGKVILDDGNEIQFKNITGIAERRRTSH